MSMCSKYQPILVEMSICYVSFDIRMKKKYIFNVDKTNVLYNIENNIFKIVYGG